MRRALTLVVALLVGGALVGAPAQATGSYGSVTGMNGVLYDDCLSYPFGYALSVPADAGYRDLEVRLYEPDGHYSQTATVYPDTNAATGTGSFLLCTQTDLYGRYTMRASVAWGSDSTSIGPRVALDDAQFTLRKPGSRTGMTASTRRPAEGQLVRYRVTAYDERAAGYRPRAFAWVHLEQRKGGHWVRLKGGRAMTHANGTVVIGLRHPGHHRTTKLRAVTEPTTRFTRSTSPVLRLW